MRTALFAMAALLVPMAGVRAQGILVSGRVGLAGKHQLYDATCNNMHTTYGVDVQSRGPKFVQATYDGFASAGGGDDLCLTPGNVAVSAGVQINVANRFLLGGGIRTMDRGVSFELAALAGFISAKRGYRTSNEGGGTHLSPQVGLRSSIIVGRILVLSLGGDVTRLARQETLVSTNTTTRSSSWKPMGTVSIGLRLPPK